MSIFNKIKELLSGKGTNKIKTIPLEIYQAYSPVKKVIYILLYLEEYYKTAEGLLFLNPHTMQPCATEESLSLIYEYCGDFLPKELVKNPGEIKHKETYSYFLGLYLYKELTGEIYNYELNHPEILKPGIYQFLRNSLNGEIENRSPYPEDLLFLLQLEKKQDIENKLQLKHDDIAADFLFVESAELFSTVGLIRKENQDSADFYAAEGAEHNGVFIVADGMGGGAEGKKASMMAVNLILSNYKKFEMENRGKHDIAEKINEFIKNTILQVNKTILNYGNINKLKDMGTTLSMVLIHDNKLYIGHVGDSRIYFVRDKKVYQLSLDQSNVEVLLREGKISEAQKDNYEKNVLAYYLGFEGLTGKEICTLSDNNQLSNLKTDTGNNNKDNNCLHLRKNDLFFVCSDGVWDVFEEKNIYEELTMEYQGLKRMIYSRIPTDNFTFIRAVVINY